MRRLPAAATTAAAAAAACAAAPPAALGHGQVYKDSGGVINYVASVVDPDTNDVRITQQGSFIRIFDPASKGGLSSPVQSGNDCQPGTAEGQDGSTAEILCPVSGTSKLSLDTNEREDKITIGVNLTTAILSGAGADQITGGPGRDQLDAGSGNDTIAAGPGDDVVNGATGDDVIRGGEGQDRIQAGEGVDQADGEAGNDEISVRDPYADTAVCGEGADRVVADETDRIEATAGCETVDRGRPAPTDPGGSGSGSGGGTDPGAGSGTSPDAALLPPSASRDDRAAPRIRVGGSTAQRLGRGTLRVAAVSLDEPVVVQASAVVSVGVRTYTVASARTAIRVRGAGAELRVRLGARALKNVRRRLRRGKRVTARVTVLATDAAGNSTVRALPRIRLKK